MKANPEIDARLRELCELQDGPDNTYTSGEIARFCGCSEALIRGVEQRAVRKIRRQLLREGIMAEADHLFQ